MALWKVSEHSSTSGANTFCQLPILPSGNFANRLFYKYDILHFDIFSNNFSTYHLANCPAVISLTGHFVNWSFCQLVNLLTGHFVSWSFCQLVIWSSGYFANWSFCQLVILTTDHFSNLLIEQMYNHFPLIKSVSWWNCQLFKWLADDKMQYDWLMR